MLAEGGPQAGRESQNGEPNNNERVLAKCNCTSFAHLPAGNIAVVACYITLA
jgi:hypothetical protein